MKGIHLTAALIRKRRELTCAMNRLAEDHARLLADLAALDAVIIQVDPDVDLEAIPALRVVNRRRWAPKGHVTRAVFSALREANGPMTTDEVTLRVADGLDQPVSHCLRKSVYKALDVARLRGLVRSLEETGLWLQWEIVR